MQQTAVELLAGAQPKKLLGFKLGLSQRGLAGKPSGQHRTFARVSTASLRLRSIL